MNTVHLCDCMEFMKTCKDNQYDLAIVDPPYGININMNMGRKKGQIKKHEDKNWDKSIPKDEYFKELFRVSKNQIVWGGNYFPALWARPCLHFIFWDKLVPTGMSFSDGELAWTSFNRAIRKFTYRNITGDKIHPTQKPVALYKWLLQHYAKPGNTIFDSHVGSGSIRIACYDMGFNFEGCEIDPDYWQAQEKRFMEYSSQLRLDI